MVYNFFSMDISVFVFLELPAQGTALNANAAHVSSWALRCSKLRSDVQICTTHSFPITVSRIHRLHITICSFVHAKMQDPINYMEGHEATW